MFRNLIEEVVLIDFVIYEPMTLDKRANPLVKFDIRCTMLNFANLLSSVYSRLNTKPESG